MSTRIRVLDSEHGSTFPPSATFVFDPGDEFSIKATPDKGYKFSYFEIMITLGRDFTSTANPYSVNITASTPGFSVRAVFEPVPVVDGGVWIYTGNERDGAWHIAIPWICSNGTWKKAKAWMSDGLRWRRCGN